MQNKFKEYGITATTNDKKVTIEIPIKSIIDKYNNNIDGCDNRVKSKYKADFINYIAENLIIEKNNSETGNSYLFDSIYRIFEDIDDDYGLEFIKYNDDEEDDDEEEE